MPNGFSINVATAVIVNAMANVFKQLWKIRIGLAYNKTLKASLFNNRKSRQVF